MPSQLVRLFQDDAHFKTYAWLQIKLDYKKIMPFVFDYNKKF